MVNLLLNQKPCVSGFFIKKGVTKCMYYVYKDKSTVKKTTQLLVAIIIIILVLIANIIITISNFHTAS
ncbi:hypothetical protein GCM10022397_33350 [Flavivirga jejuensis]